MAESTTTPAKAILPKSVFAVEVPNHQLLKLAYDAFLANGRQASATTLQRGEVRGGGKKPWKQKGTGRARFGSSRNPIWRGGGIVFGPRGNENYTLKVSKTSKLVALRQALTLANQAKKIVVTDVKTTGKTAVYLPLKGVSLIDTAGQVFYGPQEDQMLFTTLKNNLNLDLVEVQELDMEINDPEFALAMAKKLVAMIEGK